VHPRTHAPWAAVALNGALLALVAAAGSVTLSASVGGFLYVTHFVFPLVALAVLRRRPDLPEPGFTTPLPRIVLPLAGLACAGLLAASGGTGVAGGLAWLAAGWTADTLRRRHAGLP
jgi:APA family basic amino acid/polyamine antiporter